MRRLVGPVLLVGLLVSGCSGDPEPRFEEPAESTPASGTSSATSTPTDEPEPWQERSKAGAVAFAKHWVAVFNEAQQTGDTSALRRLGRSSCMTCRRVAQRIEAVLDAGGFFRGPGWRVLDAQANDIKDGQTSVALDIERRRQRVRESSADPVVIYPRSEAVYRADVEWIEDAWRMRELVDFR